MSVIYPSREPLFTHLLAEKWLAASQTRKLTARGTILRYSAAHGCGRQMGYYAFAAPYTEIPDVANVWQAGLGTLVHEALQEAVAEKFPNALFECSSSVAPFLSGSADIFVFAADMPEGFGNTLLELKTMGEYGFFQQVGWNDKGFGKMELKQPQGPKSGAIAQAGMNALGIEKERNLTVDTLLLGSLWTSCLSVNKAAKVGASGFDRFGAEFEVPRETWEPLATEELRRMALIAQSVQHVTLPGRIAVGDDGSQTTLTPDAEKRPWNCDYCPYVSRCKSDGPGEVTITLTTKGAP